MRTTKKLERVLESVEQGLGLGANGLTTLRQAFGEERNISMVAQLTSNYVPEGVNERFTALAFALTQPKDMRP